MDLQLIKQKKRELENMINDLITTFSVDTEVQVTDLHFAEFKNYPVSSQKKFTGTIVKVDLNTDWDWDWKFKKEIR